MLWQKNSLSQPQNASSNRSDQQLLQTSTDDVPSEEKLNIKKTAIPQIRSILNKSFFGTLRIIWASTVQNSGQNCEVNRLFGKPGRWEGDQKSFIRDQNTLPFLRLN